MCWDELTPCTAHEEQSNCWYGMASKQGTNSPGGGINARPRKMLYPGKKCHSHARKHKLFIAIRIFGVTNLSLHNLNFFPASYLP